MVVVVVVVVVVASVGAVCEGMLVASGVLLAATEGVGSAGVVVVIGCVVVLLAAVVELAGVLVSDLLHAVIPTIQSPVSVANRICLRIGDFPLNKEVNKTAGKPVCKIKHIILNEAGCKASLKTGYKER